MPPGAWLAFAVFALAAAQSAVGLLTWRPAAGDSVFSTPEADATHLVMNAVMAAMVTPAYGASIRTAGSVALWLAAVGVAVALAWRGFAGPRGALSFRAQAAAAAYHVLMLGAMIYALAALPDAMGAMCGAGVMGPKPTPVGHAFLVTRGLAALFVLDGVVGTVGVTALPRQLLEAEASPVALTETHARPRSADARVRRLRLGFVPHLVMDVGMAWMLAAG